MARLNHADNARVITTGILRQTSEKIPETSSGEVSPPNWSRFHTVCKNFALRRVSVDCRGKSRSKFHSQRLFRYLTMRIGLDSPHKGSPVRQAAAREDVLDRGECEFLVRQLCIIERNGSPSGFRCFVGRR